MAADDLRLLTVVEVAERLGISVSQVYNLFSRSELRKVNLSSTGKRAKMRVRTDDLLAYIEARTSSAVNS